MKKLFTIAALALSAFAAHAAEWVQFHDGNAAKMSADIETLKWMNDQSIRVWVQYEFKAVQQSPEAPEMRYDKVKTQMVLDCADLTTKPLNTVAYLRGQTVVTFVPDPKLSPIVPDSAMSSLSDGLCKSANERRVRS